MLEVVSVNAVGAFLDWGLSKDILVPFREQKQNMQVGESYLVYVYLDEATNRIVASSKLSRFLNKKPIEYKPGQEVDILISNRSEIGYTVIINQAHRGILYKNEVFHKIFRGQHYTGYIVKVRDDEKIDVRLQKPGLDKVDDFSDELLNELKRSNGFLAFNDNTPPEQIYSTFGVSKKTFKKAVGALFRQRLIEITEQGIKLL